MELNIQKCLDSWNSVSLKLSDPNFAKKETTDYGSFLVEQITTSAGTIRARIIRPALPVRLLWDNDDFQWPTSAKMAINKAITQQKQLDVLLGKLPA